MDMLSPLSFPLNRRVKVVMSAVRIAAIMGVLFLTGVANSVLLGAGETAAWRSRFYPEDWTPAFTAPGGQFLHDFSYAGYRNGEQSLPDMATAPVFDVVRDFAADVTGRTDCTAAFQKACDAAAEQSPAIVFVPEGLFRCDGAFTIRSSHTVLRGAGPEKSRIFFTSWKDMEGKGHISIGGNIRRDQDIPLIADAGNRDTRVRVADASGLAVGDDVTLGWIITDAFVAAHQMTGVWKVFNGKWRPVFRRRVVGIVPGPESTSVELDIPLRYPALVRDGASIRRETGFVEDSGIEHLGVSTAVEWLDAWAQPGVQAILLRGVRNCWVRNVQSFASPLPEAAGYHLQNGGILVVDSKNVTVADCMMAKAQNRGDGGAGYLFQVSRSGEVLTRDCRAVEGRHNFIQNWDFGTSGCVWLRCYSARGRGYIHPIDPIGYPGYCEYHHSLAMACLVDQCELDDGWFGGNRHDWSSGAGNTVTQSVYWNTKGKGRIRSWQAGDGYIIGTEGVKVEVALSSRFGKGTAPVDITEGIGKGASLYPRSLYEDQLRRRLDAVAGTSSPAGQ